MRTQVKITGLTPAQMERLELRLRDDYEFTPGVARVCVIFSTGHPQAPERHVEMPVRDLALLISEVHVVGMAEDILSPDELPGFLEEVRTAADPARHDIYSGGTYAYDESGLAHFPLGDGTVRNDCAFCQLPRTPKDDNHRPFCSYWSVGPGKFVAEADLPEWVKAEMDADPEKYPDWKRDDDQDDMNTRPEGADQ
jgi:hypothetical protein